MRTTAVSILLAALFLGGCIFCRAAFPPNIPPPEISGGDLERGRYLVEHVSACFACHGARDWRYYGAPHDPAKRGTAGEVFREGKVVVATPNISPTTLALWSDGEIARAIANGVSKDGHALFPIMPYKHYVKMAKPDLAAVVAYLRTLDAQPLVDIPARELPGPLPFLVSAFVEEGEPPDAAPAPGDAGYGEYLTEMAACNSCHTPMKSGRPIESMAFAGGREFALPTGGIVRSSNITPHETGIASYTREAFIARFRAMAPENIRAQEIPPGSMATVMPWSEYSGMSDADLGAIFDHLRTIEPIESRVIRFNPDPPSDP